MAAKTQCHGHMPLSGRRFGSFAGKTAFVATANDGEASFFRPQDVAEWSQFYARPGSAMGHRHHHTFSLLFGFIPTGA